MKRWIYFLMLTMPACAQVEHPQLTWILDAANAVRPVYGLPGSATVGDPAAERVVSMACSSRDCVMKMDAALHSTSTAPTVETGRGWVKGSPSKRGLAARRAALTPEGPALIATADTETYVYFLWSQQFARWRDGEPEYVAPAGQGDVLSLRASGDGFDYAVAREDGTWIEHYSVRDQSVMILASLGPTGAVMLLEGGGIMLASADDVRLMRPYSGDEPLDDVVFAISGVGQFIAVPGGFVQVNTPSGVWLLSTASAEPESFLLPPPASPEAAQ